MQPPNQAHRPAPPSEAELRARVHDCIRQGWAIVIEHTDDPRPQNSYWNIWGVPMLDEAGACFEIEACRAAHPGHHIRILACEAATGQARVRYTRLVHVPPGAGPGPAD